MLQPNAIVGRINQGNEWPKDVAMRYNIPFHRVTRFQTGKNGEIMSNSIVDQLRLTKIYRTLVKSLQDSVEWPKSTRKMTKTVKERKEMSLNRTMMIVTHMMNNYMSMII